MADDLLLALRTHSTQVSTNNLARSPLFQSIFTTLYVISFTSREYITYDSGMAVQIHSPRHIANHHSTSDWFRQEIDHPHQLPFGKWAEEQPFAIKVSQYIKSDLTKGQHDESEPMHLKRPIPHTISTIPVFQISAIAFSRQLTIISRIFTISVIVASEPFSQVGSGGTLPTFGRSDCWKKAKTTRASVKSSVNSLSMTIRAYEWPSLTPCSIPWHPVLRDSEQPSREATLYWALSSAMNIAGRTRDFSKGSSPSGA
jgi:hypothetical protein